MSRIGSLLSDHELVAEAQAGCPLALNTLLGAVRVAVLPYCRRRLSTYAGGLDVAEDVTQETCVAVVDVLGRYERRGLPFAAFVYAIAANKVADAQRRFARSVLSPDEVPDEPDSSPTPEQQVLAEEDVAAALALVRLLPDRMRHVLQLRASGVSVEEVAAITGLSPNAVRVTHHRAVARLRTLIEGSVEHRERFASLRTAH